MSSIVDVREKFKSALEPDTVEDTPKPSTTKKMLLIFAISSLLIILLYIIIYNYEFKISNNYKNNKKYIEEDFSEQDNDPLFQKF